MIDALNFVKGAVARKDFVPALTHFLIKNRTIMGFNGQLALCSPIEVDFECAPKADDFLRVINACSNYKETISLHMNENGKLVVRCGKFRAFVECVDASTYPAMVPSGETLPLKETAHILTALEHLMPFVAEDASRPWACGILFDGQCAYATNNIVLIQYWLGHQMPARINIPVSAVRELIRIGEHPVSLQMDGRRLTVRYKDGHWLSTQLFDIPWPDVSERFDGASNQAPFPEGFFDALDVLAPFTDEIGRCHLLEGRLSTVATRDGGKSVEVAGLVEGGCFNLKQLINLKAVARTIDFTQYPAAVRFAGKVSRGIICGIKV
jgi:DNA polymerase III sliding clamp (beta) subunit (PCNA family)